MNLLKECTNLALHPGFFKLDLNKLPVCMYGLFMTGSHLLPLYRDGGAPHPPKEG